MTLRARGYKDRLIWERVRTCTGLTTKTTVRTRGDKTIVFGTTATDLNGEAGPLRFYWHPPGTLFLIEVDPLFFAPVADLSFEGEINWRYHGVKEWQGY